MVVQHSAVDSLLHGSLGVDSESAVRHGGSALACSPVEQRVGQNVAGRVDNPHQQLTRPVRQPKGREDNGIVDDT